MVAAGGRGVAPNGPVGGRCGRMDECAAHALPRRMLRLRGLGGGRGSASAQDSAGELLRRRSVRFGGPAARPRLAGDSLGACLRAFRAAAVRPCLAGIPADCPWPPTAAAASYQPGCRKGHAIGSHRRRRYPLDRGALRGHRAFGSFGGGFVRGRHRGRMRHRPGLRAPALAGRRSLRALPGAVANQLGAAGALTHGRPREGEPSWGRRVALRALRLCGERRVLRVLRGCRATGLQG